MFYLCREATAPPWVVTQVSEVQFTTSSTSSRIASVLIRHELVFPAGMSYSSQYLQTKAKEMSAQIRWSKWPNHGHFGFFHAFCL